MGQYSNLIAPWNLQLSMNKISIVSIISSTIERIFQKSALDCY